MTYCIGIKASDGLVFASDSRTNAGLDNVNIYSKMFTYDVGDRTIIIVTSGNLGTSQAVYKSIEKDLKDTSGIINLNTCQVYYNTLPQHMYTKQSVSVYNVLYYYVTI